MKIGELVEVLDDNITGIISAIDGDRITILCDDGFEMEFTKSELIVRSGEFSKSKIFNKNISEVLSEKQVKKHKNTRRVKPKERTAPPMVIDLHIHQLVPNEKGLSNYDKLTIQLDTAKRQLDFAIRKRIQRVVFIHGVGEGVLKVELEYLFRRYDNLRFYDADFQKYGRGATEVYIYQNKSS